MPSSSTVPLADEVKARLQRETETLRDAALNTVHAQYNLWSTGAVSLDTLCSRAGDAFDQYAAAAFAALLRSGAPSDAEASPNWMREYYRRAIVTVAHAIRDTIAESSPRHAVAQTLQTRMLRAETRFRQLIDEPPGR